MVPKKEDIIILVSGTYLIIILAAVIHFIKESYRKLIEKNNLEKQKQQAELKLKETKLKVLQGQIHPHFLFNMLNNLYGLVKEDMESSRDVIMKLSNLLDYMLYECDKTEVSLNSELIFIKNYVELERIRHDEDFNVEVNFPDKKNDIQIAPLILFPFVENAFKHGFHYPENSFISMTLSADNNRIIFYIENSMAKGNDDKYLNQEGKGIGLKNIKERLKLIYQNNYQLEIDDQDDKYKVNLQIDLH